MDSAKEKLAGHLRFQAEACRHLGSPLYAGLLEQAVADVEAGGPTWRVLRGHEDDPATSALALRLMGAVNRLVLERREPRLADLYGTSAPFPTYMGGNGALVGSSNPCVSQPPEPEAVWGEFRAVVERNLDELCELIELPVQTNEVGRCAALLPGFLSVAAATGLPLALLEMGASAGLNLRWDRYHYRADGFEWGPADSRLTVDFELSGEGCFPEPERVEIAERRGCDAAAVDPARPEGELTLLSYVWPDQTARIERLRAAIEIARKEPLTIDCENAGPWLARTLAPVSPGTATVIFHSIFAQYVPEEEWMDFRETLSAAGERASREAPLAWLRMEPAGPWADVRLTMWPGGEERHLASVGYHGSPVELLAS